MSSVTAHNNQQLEARRIKVPNFKERTADGKSALSVFTAEFFQEPDIPFKQDEILGAPNYNTSVVKIMESYEGTHFALSRQLFDQVTQIYNPWLAVLSVFRSRAAAVVQFPGFINDEGDVAMRSTYYHPQVLGSTGQHNPGQELVRVTREKVVGWKTFGGVVRAPLNFIEKMEHRNNFKGDLKSLYQSVNLTLAEQNSVAVMTAARQEYNEGIERQFPKTLANFKSFVAKSATATFCVQKAGGSWRAEQARSINTMMRKGVQPRTVLVTNTIGHFIGNVRSEGRTFEEQGARIYNVGKPLVLTEGINPLVLTESHSFPMDGNDLDNVVDPTIFYKYNPQTFPLRKVPYNNGLLPGVQGPDGRTIAFHSDMCSVAIPDGSARGNKKLSMLDVINNNGLLDQALDNEDGDEDKVSLKLFEQLFPKLVAQARDLGSDLNDCYQNTTLGDVYKTVFGAENVVITDEAEADGGAEVDGQAGGAGYRATTPLSRKLSELTQRFEADQVVFATPFGLNEEYEKKVYIARYGQREEKIAIFVPLAAGSNFSAQDAWVEKANIDPTHAPTELSADTFGKTMLLAFTLAADTKFAAADAEAILSGQVADFVAGLVFEPFRREALLEYFEEILTNMARNNKLDPFRIRKFFAVEDFVRQANADAVENPVFDINIWSGMLYPEQASAGPKTLHEAPKISRGQGTSKRRKILNGAAIHVDDDVVDQSVCLTGTMSQMPARDLNSYRKAFAANKRLPFGGQVFRLDMLCETGSATYLPKAEEAGLNIMDESNIILGHNAKTFEMTVAARVTSGAFVPYPSRIGLSPFIACLAIHTGFGTEPVVRGSMSGNGQSKGDLIFCATPLEYEFNSFYEDFTNNPSPKLVEVQNVNTGYDRGKLFSTFYGRAMVDATPFHVSDPKDPQAPTPSLAIAAAHLAWNPATNRIDRHVKGYDDMGANATWETYAMLQDGGGDSNYVYSHSLHQ